jgi:hypothetical protein
MGPASGDPAPATAVQPRVRAVLERGGASPVLVVGEGSVVAPDPAASVTRGERSAYDVHVGSEPTRPSERRPEPSARMIISQRRRAKTM